MTRRAFSVSEQNRVGDAARKAGGYSELIAAQRIEARSDETLQAARPEGQEPDGEADAPTPNQEQSQ